VKTTASTTYFYPVWLNHIVSGRLEGGWLAAWSSEPLPISERFYLGGPNTIRSFKFRQVSPVDEFGTKIGGNGEVLGNAEYIVPLPFNFRVAAFFDVGNVYGFTTPFDITDLRYAAGPGIRWASPFGPIRVDYGVNLNPRKGDSFGEVQFSMGAPF
jgi:outer membrane protein insertion porin family